MSKKKYGMWTLIKKTTSSKRWHSRFICRCDCGKTKIVYFDNLLSGKSKCCGCRGGTFKHGLYKTPEYRTWIGIKMRCFNPENTNFKNYGGRGIKVCDKWKNSFPSFLEDMGNKPSSKHSIDRIDNEGDYSPDNCRWATRVQQNNNQRKRVKREVI